MGIYEWIEEQIKSAEQSRENDECKEYWDGQINILLTLSIALHGDIIVSAAEMARQQSLSTVVCR